MIVCHDSYNGNIRYGSITVKFEESDLNNPMFGIGFTFHHLIVPKYLEEQFKASDKYQFIKPCLDAMVGGTIKYVNFGVYREKQLATLLD